MDVNKCVASIGENIYVPCIIFFADGIWFSLYHGMEVFFAFRMVPWRLVCFHGSWDQGSTDGPPLAPAGAYCRYMAEPCGWEPTGSKWEGTTAGSGYHAVAEH